MSDQIKHECGVAFIRLLKPLSFYQQKYGTALYGLNKLYLLMEKQHNRGQEGAGLATVKLDMPPGEEYIWRERMEGKNAIQDIFAKINKDMVQNAGSDFTNPVDCKAENPFAGELYLGHLRYSTTGKSGLSYIHPFLRRHNWKARTLLLAGNFNLTNVDEIFNHLTAQGQHPREKADTFLMLESLGNQLDREVQAEYDLINAPAYNSNNELVRSNYSRFFLGLGYSFPLGRKGAINTLAMYDILYKVPSVFNSPFVLRVYFTI